MNIWDIVLIKHSNNIWYIDTYWETHSLVDNESWKVWISNENLSVQIECYSIVKYPKWNTIYVLLPYWVIISSKRDQYIVKHPKHLIKAIDYQWALTHVLSIYKQSSIENKTTIEQPYPLTTETMCTEIKEEIQAIEAIKFFSVEKNLHNIYDVDQKIKVTIDILKEAKCDINIKLSKLQELSHELNVAFASKDKSKILSIQKMYKSIREYMNNFMDQTVLFLWTKESEEKTFDVQKFFL